MNLSVVEAQKRCAVGLAFGDSAPFLAQTQAPLMAQVVGDNLGMKNRPLSRDLLATNLDRLMKRGEKPLTPRDVARTKYWSERGEEGPISAKTVERILKRLTQPTLDHVDELARYFALQPWQLLVPGFNPESPPHLALTDEAKEAFERIGKHFSNLQGQGG